MESLQDIVERQQRERDSYDDPLVEKLIAALLATAEENCVLSDRLDTVRRLAATGAVPDDAAIDGWEPDEKVIGQRLERHRRYFEKLFAGLTG